MNQPTLFLDFDGVLHPSICRSDQYFCRVPLLVQAIDGANVQIVLSTSWRLAQPWKELLDHFPSSFRHRIISATGPAFSGPKARWEEIVTFARSHRISHWRALDDSAFEFPTGCAELILCNARVGLAEEQAKVLRSWAMTDHGEL